MGVMRFKQMSDNDWKINGGGINSFFICQQIFGNENQSRSSLK